MQIKLANGTILMPLIVTGGKRTVQGVARDTLQFVFTPDYSMEELDAIFSEENCEEITVTDENGQGVYKNYSLRCELKKETVVAQLATDETDAVMEQRIFVSMSQKTYTEMQLQNLTETVDTLVLDSLT